MSGSVYAIATMVMAAGTVWGAQGTVNQPPAPAAPSASSPATSSPAATAETPPKIVVHEGAAASGTDARVQVGAMKISVAPWAGVAAPSNEPSSHNQMVPKPEVPPATAIAGAIAMPENTLGPGEPMWRQREREDAERRLAEARAQIAEAEADRAARSVGRDRGYAFWGNSYLHVPGWRYLEGPRGPVTTTVTRFDDLGSTAQRAYADAAYPRLNGTTDARDAIVRQFGRDATPPINRIQNDIDAAHRNANSEKPR